MNRIELLTPDFDPAGSIGAIYQNPETEAYYIFTWAGEAGIRSLVNLENGAPWSSGNLRRIPKGFRKVHAGVRIQLEVGE